MSLSQIGPGAGGAPPQTQPAKTTLFAGGKAPGLRRNFLRPNKIIGQMIKSETAPVAHSPFDG
jgi:hypothetical protein